MLDNGFDLYVPWEEGVLFLCNIDADSWFNFLESSDDVFIYGDNAYSRNSVVALLVEETA